MFHEGRLLGRHSLHTAKKCGHTQPRQSLNLSDPISHASLMCLGGFLHLYLELLTCDRITEDGC